MGDREMARDEAAGERDRCQAARSDPPKPRHRAVDNCVCADRSTGRRARADIVRFPGAALSAIPPARWTEVLHLRDEVRHSDGSVGELQMSLAKAVYQTVPVPY